MTDNIKIIIIGLDGACLNIIKKINSEKKLKTFDMMIERGSITNMESTINTLSPSAWISFFTGASPAKHGIFDFEIYKKNSYETEIVNSTLINKDIKFLWDYLNENNKRTFLINIPFMYPKKEINGIFISGFPACDANEKSVHPTSLIRDIKDSGYLFGIDFGWIENYWSNKSNYLNELYRFIKNVEKVYNKRIEFVKKMLISENYDVIVAIFDSGDRLQHYCWHLFDENHCLYDEKLVNIFGDPISKFYHEMDKFIRDIIKKVDENTIFIIVSDHGFGPIEYISFLNSYLKNLNYKGKNVLNLKKTEIEKIKYADNISKGQNDIEGQSIALSQKDSIDWKNTIAWSFWNGGNVYINTSDRFRSGLINSDSQREDILDFLIENLKCLKNNIDGEKIIDNIIRSDSIFAEKISNRTPDLFIRFKSGILEQGRFFINYKENITSNTPYILSIKDPLFWKSRLPPKTGDHVNSDAKYGLFGIFSKSDLVQNDLSGININICDILPTILNFYKIKPIKNISGKCITKIFKND